MRIFKRRRPDIPNVIDQAVEPGDRLVIHVNSNLKMSRGKYAAQAVHAALQAVGAHPGTPVIVLGASPEKILTLPVRIHDAGWTEVPAGSLTAGAEWKKDRG